MPEPFLAMITPLTGSGAPGVPSHPIAMPPPYPDQGLPPGSPGAPSHPIYHPGHPDHGRPAHPIYNPAYPDQGLPGGGVGVWPGPRPGHPIELPPGGNPVPPNVWPNPPVPPQYANQTIVAVKQPGQEWKVQTYDVKPDQGLPAPKPV